MFRARAAGLLVSAVMRSRSARHISIGVHTTSKMWVFSVNNGTMLELGPLDDQAIIALRLINTLSLPDRKLRKGMVWDVGPYPRRGIPAPQGCEELAEGHSTSPTRKRSGCWPGPKSATTPAETPKPQRSPTRSDDRAGL